METQTLKVVGMSCDVCAGHVRQALRKLPGVETVSVDLAGEQAIVAFDPDRTSAAAMREAIENEGYEAPE